MYVQYSFHRNFYATRQDEADAGATFSFTTEKKLVSTVIGKRDSIWGRFDD